MKPNKLLKLQTQALFKLLSSNNLTAEQKITIKTILMTVFIAGKVEALDVVANKYF